MVRLALFVPLLLAGCLMIEPAASGSAPTGSTPPTLDRAALERSILDEVNDVRRRNALAPLADDGRLASLARAHSDDMARRGYFEHVSPDGQRPADRLRAAGYDYSRVAENLYWTTRYRSRSNRGTDWISARELARETVASWMESPGHRRNLLLADVSHGGVGIALDGDRMLVTLKLAQPR